MPGRLAVDFGTSNTVLAVWDASRGEGVPVLLPEHGLLYPVPGSDAVPVIPSLIHYTADGRQFVGQQVPARRLAADPATMRWMKRYIARRSPMRGRVHGIERTPQQAGRDFLTAILGFAALELAAQTEEIALTVPVEAFEHFQEWLSESLSLAGFPRFRPIDEASAAALGYGANIRPGQVYLIVDFGGGTLDVSAVRIEEADRALTGRRCRVLGKAGADLGGAVLDGWLFAEVLRRQGLHDADEAARRVSLELLAACEEAKQRLSLEDSATVQVEGIATTFHRADLEELFDRHDLYAMLDRTIRRALGQARERGWAEDDLRAVLLVGGSCLIPGVQKTIQRIFGRERVWLNRPLDAVARGAAAFVAGVDFFDHIQHDYALRVIDPATRQVAFRPLVRRGTPYPTSEPVARLTIKATHDGQSQLGLAIYELADRSSSGNGAMELVFDPSGAARLAEVGVEEQLRSEQFRVNEQAPTFLTARPPGRRGEACFEVAFGIDAARRLVVTARDLRTGEVTHCEHPVVRLT